MTNTTPKRQDYNSEWNVVFDSIVRSMRALEKRSDNKGFAEDLSEGKFSFPIVHGVRADTSNRQIMSTPVL